MHMVICSMCQCSKYLCQSVVQELGTDVSTGLFTALTMGEREKRKAEVKVTGGREEGGAE